MFQFFTLDFDDKGTQSQFLRLLKQMGVPLTVPEK